MNKSNKIIETMPVGYYIVGVTTDNIYYEIPILASVKYFNNKNENDEVISTNYITLNSYGYNNCYKTSSNYDYIKHPDNLIYKIYRRNDGINKGITVDEFKKKFMKNEINDVFDKELNDIIEGAQGSGDEVYDEVYDEIREEIFDDYSNDFESDISSSDRELLDYYY